MTDTPDYYEVLQVRPDASQEVLEAAYERLLQKYRGLAAAEGEARIRELSAAWEALGDSARRAAYDASLRAQAGNRSPAGSLTSREDSGRQREMGDAAGEQEFPVEAGPWIRQAEELFPAAWAAMLIAVALIGIYFSVRQLPADNPLNIFT